MLNIKVCVRINVLFVEFVESEGQALLSTEEEFWFWSGFRREKLPFTIPWKLSAATVHGHRTAAWSGCS